MASPPIIDSECYGEHDPKDALSGHSTPSMARSHSDSGGSSDMRTPADEMPPSKRVKVSGLALTSLLFPELKGILTFEGRQ